MTNSNPTYKSNMFVAFKLHKRFNFSWKQEATNHKGNIIQGNRDNRGHSREFQRLKVTNSKLYELIKSIE